MAIVGRANVGKSSLFNAVLERREAIVAREAGTTRDNVVAKVSVTTGGRAGQTAARHEFWLVDTAGVKDPDDSFELTIQEQIRQAADSADVICVVVEAHVMLTEEDRRVAKLALRTKKPVLLIINKIDQARRLDLSGFDRLGIKTTFRTSTYHREGIDDLIRALLNILPQVTQPSDDHRLRLALVGRPNVGKSQLFNTLAKKQQAIVSDRAGTTRDVNRSVVKYKQRQIELMDTAGIRRAGKIGTGVEHFSVLRSLAAIEQADICLMLMDSHELNTQLDQKIAGMVKDAGKGLVLVVSKWDAVEDKTAHTQSAASAAIAEAYDFVPWAPLVFTSAVTGQNVTTLFELALDIDLQRQQRIATAELNRWLRQMVDKHPPAGLKNRNPKLNYMVQEDDNPTPAFKIFGSAAKYVHWSYRRYLERGLRERYGFAGTPIELWFIEKHVTHKHGNSPTLAARKLGNRPETVRRPRGRSKTSLPPEA